MNQIIKTDESMQQLVKRVLELEEQGKTKEAAEIRRELKRRATQIKMERKLKRLEGRGTR